TWVLLCSSRPAQSREQDNRPQAAVLDATTLPCRLAQAWVWARSSRPIVRMPVRIGVITIEHTASGPIRYRRVMALFPRATESIRIARAVILVNPA
ncbi:MAG: hypothetical protein ABJC89_25200, partial [Acidobacteriota bacterium]